jgi:hypothetical protein
LEVEDLNSKQKRLSIEEVAGIYQRFEDSGLSLAAFSRQEKIPYSQLNYYKRRLFKEGLLLHEPPSLLHSRFQKNNSSSALPPFVQLVPDKPKNSLQQELTLKWGSFQIALKSGFEPQLLSDILAVVKHYV